MLSTALKFQKAFERLEDEDPHYPLELSDGCPITRDWDDARYFADFLHKFYDATVRLSGSLYVTSNLYFTEACAIESFLLGWEKGVEFLNDVSVGGMVKKMKAKFGKYWGKMEKVNMLMAKDSLKCIYDEYEKLNAGSSSSSQTSIDMEVDQPCLVGSAQTLAVQSKFQKHLEEVELDGEMTKVDKYLEERCEKVTSNFDILNWWKVNSSKYKVLSEVARDVLAIPVSTVSSEATFSMGGRVIDQFRNSLTPKVVECLICMQDWLCATPLPFDVEENIAEMEELELALQKIALNELMLSIQYLDFE
ncbi:hypothetical protein Acr_12g0011280 [Actinidia rufa]|uniref:Zinc finger BED domain-containing protein RICESLEEPER 2-like n=1 Tax=Actinidia rufa TaxID=165716 RepID=A0A7J0FKY2_9ERIC|nr:hypothetical protein Acr_12g0011280 [Actinidia rufa]